MGVTTGLGGEERMAFQRKVAIGVKAPYPGFIEPALATYIEKVPGGERWFHEIKFDGYRGAGSRRPRGGQDLHPSRQLDQASLQDC